VLITVALGVTYCVSNHALVMLDIRDIAPSGIWFVISQLRFVLQVKYLSVDLQTSLANTAIDNPMRRTKQTLVNSILEFLDTDTVW